MASRGRNRAPLRAHGIPFEAATGVFRDPLALTIYDSEHSEAEERWATVGRAEDGGLLVVSHTFEEGGATRATVRIISAREASRHERKDYDEGPR
jgi:uncharacterized DUF497 family protein